MSLTGDNDICDDDVDDRNDNEIIGVPILTRSSWLNCALRDDEAVYWVSIGHSEAVAVGT